MMHDKKSILIAFQGEGISFCGKETINRLKHIFEANGINVICVNDLDEFGSNAFSLLNNKALIIDWNIGGNDYHKKAIALINMIKEIHESFPVFVFDSKGDASDISAEYLKIINGFISPFEDTESAICGRVLNAIENYENTLLPPMYRALKKFSKKWEYSWHTPGHTSGTAFLKTPVSYDFFNYFGENLMRSDLSISVGDLGSLLDHTGAIGEGEEYAAEVFGADRSYTVTNGTSTSNKIIFMACVARGQVALCDRNCHKSIEQALSITGAVPYYLIPTQNYLGIIGPIMPEKLENKAILDGIGRLEYFEQVEDKNPIHAVVTNSTYDGLCYNAVKVEKLLGKSVDRMHFDEAWYGYARFNPIYENRYAMRGKPEDRDNDAMTVFCTHSTHKLLAALSQASFIHVRDGKNAIDHEIFNETFMMHGSTSPNYAIIASNDIAAAMMSGDSGKKLTDEAIKEAVTFRRTMAEIENDYKLSKEWFFKCWQPDKVRLSSGETVSFYAVDIDTLAKDSSCWVLHPGDEWHGFDNIEEDYCMLDPIKVSIVTPGINRDGFEEWGIPACVLSKYMQEHGVVPEKTTDFTILFLFSIGITKGKWNKLLEILVKFKNDYDSNKPLKLCMPEISDKYSDEYGNMGLKDLCQYIFMAMKELKITQMIPEAFTSLPKVDMLPNDAYDRLVRGHVKTVKLDEAEGKTLATGIVPYPPGIPLIMPGENAGTFDQPYLKYLKALETLDRKCKGFEHDTHGVVAKDGDYYITIID